jgi:exodeoxyribonuclease VII large subunit
VVARGGGSVMDLMAFSDETLCRTVAMLAVPVIASVGHHTDRTLIDDVAAASCSTPTHAAETAVRVHCVDGRAAMRDSARRLHGCGGRAVVQRARRLQQLTRAPAEHVARERSRLHQQLRELRAAGRRGVLTRRGGADTHALVLSRKARSTALDSARAGEALVGSGADLGRVGSAAIARRVRDLERLGLALAAHDPERTLERGYALVEDAEGGVLTSAAAAREAGRVRLRFRDDRVGARIEEEGG